MELYIGENIKRLRREKGITQETLAERMHVSAAAISKWERGETLPDISMVIPLASYFDVSADEILGFDAAKNEARIKEILDESQRLNALGKEQERFDLLVRAYDEFPNDWRIIDQYMWALFYDPKYNDDGPPFGSDVHKDEIRRLCERILEESTFDEARYSALDILAGYYMDEGQSEKALELVNHFPPMWMSKESELEELYEHGSEEWFKYLRSNIWTITENLVVKIRFAALYSNLDAPLEQIRILKKDVALLELVFEDGDYGFCHYHLSELYLWIANRYVIADELDSAFEYYEKGLAHARSFDELSRLSTHTSFLVRGYEQDMMNISSSFEGNEVTREIEYLLGREEYQKVKDMPQMQQIIEKYKPFMGEKDHR